MFQGGLGSFGQELDWTIQVVPEPAEPAPGEFGSDPHCGEGRPLGITPRPNQQSYGVTRPHQDCRHLNRWQ